MEETIRSLLVPLTRASEVVILSGAGLSADSGIPTFRDGATGLWANVDPDEVVSIDGFRRNPDRVWEWHRSMRELFAEVRPNAGHEGIAALELLLPKAKVTVITQNIDGLHQTAGSARVLEIHGSALRVRCHRHCGFVESWPAGQPGRRQCPACGAAARPDVVWFGEALDSKLLDQAIDSATRADLFFTVGTSSVVQPAASLSMIARDGGALLVEVNPHDTPFTEFADYSIRCGASTFFPALATALAQQQSKPSSASSLPESGR